MRCKDKGGRDKRRADGERQKGERKGEGLKAKWKETQ
jgi:hypothetical protein